MILSHTQEQRNLINGSSAIKLTRYEQPQQTKDYLPQKKAAIVVLVAIFIFLMHFHIYKLQGDLIQLEKAIEQAEAAFQKNKNKQHVIASSIKIQTLISKLVKLKLNHRLKQKSSVLLPLPRTLWLYTQHKLQAERMVEQFIGRNNIKIAVESGLEVKITNSRDAYDHLTQQTRNKIAKTMQNMKIYVKVDELYKIALLMEHGGIMVSSSQILLTQNLSWVFEQFNRQRTQLLLFSEQTFKSRPIYQDYFLAATKKSGLIIEVFDTLCNAMSKGVLQYNQLKMASYVDQAMNVTVVSDIIKNTINGILSIAKAQDFSVAIINKDITARVSPLCQEKLYLNLQSSKQQFKQSCGVVQYFLSNFKRAQLERHIQSSLNNSLFQTKNILPESYWYQMLDLKSNFNFFTPLPPRKVTFCILDAESVSDFTTIKESFARLEKQTFTNWVSVYFVNQVNSEMKEMASKYNKQTRKLQFVKTSGSLGRNYQLGIIKVCPPKSFIVLLKATDSFNDTKGLKSLADGVSDRGIFGALVTMNVKGQLLKPQNTYANYTKEQVNGIQPHYKDINKILNCFKVFHSDYYKILPQFVHLTHQGQYFNGRFRFLEIFLQMVKNSDQKTKNLHHNQRTKWFIKSSFEIFDVPNRIQLLPQIVINSFNWQTANKSEIVQITFKDQVRPISQTINDLIQTGHTMSDFSLFNKAEWYEPYNKRNKTAVIPKIAHLICINAKMTELSKKVFKINRELYRDFQFKIWTKYNITRETFPFSYDLLQNVLNSNKMQLSHKIAVMTDIMRQQIIYNEGGFYMDSSILLFDNVLYKWLSYKLVISTSKVFSHRWTQKMSLFGAVPKYPGLLKNIEHANLNRYNIFSNNNQQFSGLNGHKQIITAEIQNDRDTLLLDADAFNPLDYKYQRQTSTCTHLVNQINIQTKQQDASFLSNCIKQYPYSFGKQLKMLR